ncbi:MAG: adenine deaminase C-terminal domain-containing protein [Gordonibacter sp.]
MINTPSCVPAVPGFEDTGSFVGPEDIAETMDWPSVVGLGEMMNFPGILGGTDHAHGEVGETLRAGKIVTGHYSMPETDRGLNAYVASGVRCCHESTRAEDAMAKMRFGMYAMMRYGSAWKDLPVIDGKLESDIGQDVLKTFVFERHHETGKFGYGFVKGFGIKRGAMASPLRTMPTTCW